MITKLIKHKKFLWQEADFYGAANLIFSKENKPLVYRSSWMHGMGYSFSGIYHINNFIHYDEVNLPEHLVNNEETVSFLKDKNIESTAVGMPFIYTFDEFPSKKERDINNLFVPEHNISSTQDEKFADYISLCKKYNCKNLLLSSNDFEKAKRIKYDFEDIDVLCGANISNPTSIQKVSQIFQSSKAVFSNAFGSHLYYALSVGCEVHLVDEIIKNYSTEIHNIRSKAIKSSVSKSFYKQAHSNEFPFIELLNGIWGSTNQEEKKDFAEYMLGIDKKFRKSELALKMSPRSAYEKYNIITKILHKKFKRKLFK